MVVGRGRFDACASLLAVAALLAIGATTAAPVLAAAPMQGSMMIDAEGGAGDFVLDFGKHRGQALREVPREYLQWLKAKVTDKPLCRDAVERFCSELSTRGRACKSGTAVPGMSPPAETARALLSLRAPVAQVTDAEHWLSRWVLPAEIRSGFADCGVQELFMWQIECLERSGLLAGHNAVVSASTSAGKSLIADVVLFRALAGVVGAEGGGGHAGECGGGDNALGRDGADNRECFGEEAVSRGPADGATRGNCENKVIYVVPFVSLVQQRSSQLRRLTSGLAGQKGIRISECYGHKGTKLSLPGAEIAVCTIEKANSLVNRLLLSQAGAGSSCVLSLVVVDEAHMVADSERGAILELTIAKIRALLPRTQLLALSATLQEESLSLFSRWLNATVYSTCFRPLDLREHFVVDGVVRPIDCLEPRSLMSRLASAAGTGGGSDSARGAVGRRLRARFGAKDRDLLASLCVEGLEDGQSVMVFCSSKAKSESCARLLAQVLAEGCGKHSQKANAACTPQQSSKTTMLRAALIEELARSQSGIDPALAAVVPHGVAFHHAGLTAEERELIQDAFSAGTLNILACTSTLAAGVNLPAGRVIVREPYVGMQELDITRYRQMVGRAGRKGFDSAGDCYLMIKPSELALAARLCVGDLPMVSSAMCSSLQCEKEGKEEEAAEEEAIRRLVLEAVVHGVDAHQLLAKTLLFAEEERGVRFCDAAERKAGEEGAVAPLCEVSAETAAAGYDAGKGLEGRSDRVGGGIGWRTGGGRGDGTGKCLKEEVKAAVEWLERKDFIRAKGLVVGMESTRQGGNPNEQLRGDAQRGPATVNAEMEASELGFATVSSGLSPEQGLQVDRAGSNTASLTPAHPHTCTHPGAHARTHARALSLPAPPAPPLSYIHATGRYTTH